MRGEHRRPQSRATQSQGSSPHARGAHRLHRAVVDARGIIPACAGSTVSPLWMGNSSRDHPRMRGEHFVQGYDDVAAEGSSPHARGAHEIRAERHGAAGIIPACAGSTASSYRRSRNTRDHPRMRGEHMAAPFWMPLMRGSSPHARGALWDDREDCDKPGIIPACAGSTLRPRRPPLAHGDHPRMRGEHHLSSLILTTGLGSSPHARGAQLV